MSLQMEKLEHNMAKITIEVPVEEMAKAVNAAYLKNKNQISIPGFRKGKVPLAMVEKMYGKGVFLEDAANAVIPGAYDKAVKECEEIAFLDLGPESIKKLKVENFKMIVAIDYNGNSVFGE